MIVLPIYDAISDGTCDVPLNPAFGWFQHRLLGKGLSGENPHLFTDEERDPVRIVNNTIFSACQLSINYTTYNICRNRDTINPNTNPYVMLRSPEDGAGVHPYWYAQVLKVYHTNVSIHPGVLFRSMHGIVMGSMAWHQAQVATSTIGLEGDQFVFAVRLKTGEAHTNTCCGQLASLAQYPMWESK